MKTFIRNLVLACAVTTAPASAGLILTLDPADGLVGGAAGGTVGWGFTFTTDDANYYVPTMLEFCIGVATPNTGTCNNTPAGTFSDFIASVNGLIIGPVLLPSGYSEFFDEFSQTGLGAFAIDPLALSQQLSGTIYVYYDVYQGNPFEDGVQQPSGIASQSAQVNIDRDEVLPGPGPGPGGVPEPNSLLLMGTGAISLYWRAKTRRSRSGHVGN